MYLYFLQKKSTFFTEITVFCKKKIRDIFCKLDSFPLAPRLNFFSVNFKDYFLQLKTRPGT